HRREAPDLAEKIRAAVAAHGFRLDDGTVLEKTCSIGFASWPFAPEHPHAVTWGEIVDLADLGLYAAKRSGRNRWVGIEDDKAGDPEEVVKSFRENPELSVSKGEVQVYALSCDLTWT
ncbi:MAG TPA: GGDEF domain-containing protein, partial [Thermoanaerobaculia bacterium]|nr:GGDEF domain-containing protein [Thermoanaerobaculia bacterium]